jgi:hypothetical protein
VIAGVRGSLAGDVDWQRDRHVSWLVAEGLVVAPRGAGQADVAAELDATRAIDPGTRLVAAL